MRAAAVKNSRRPFAFSTNSLGLVLGAIHAALVLLVFGQYYEGNWGYVLFAIPDFPVILLLALINKVALFSFNASWLFIGTFGSIWWYLIGTWLTRIFRKQTEEDPES